ncbi:MAG: septum site-determining protein MinC [Candidatus Eremiobacteraeota bacterium]|nr:septum site-determining protein MinC [Candidatus Eremiobacteraeota bacterium]
MKKEPISFKGTRMGIMVSMSEEGFFSDMLSLLSEKIHSNKQFFDGSPVSFDLGWREVEQEDLERLLAFLEKHSLALQGIISTSLATRKVAERQGIKVIIGRLGIAEHYSRTSKGAPDQSKPSEKRQFEQKEETLMLRKTVRSGQKVEFQGNVVIQGDVNSGAQVIAQGDIIILGTLRGIAHAGAGGNASAVVMAFVLEPTQLRIADHMAITSNLRSLKKGAAVIASVVNGRITLVPFSAREGSHRL